VIRTVDLRRRYGTGADAVDALRGVSLAVGAGDIIAIMGASGSGKSTLLNILGCLDRPTAGRYELDGDDVTYLDADARATLRSRKLGFVFQSFNLLPRTTARDNVALPLVYAGAPLAEQRRRAAEALDAVGLGGLADRLPNQLSGGQQQRVAIARAIVNHPRVLLADEPTGNLDSRTSEEIMRLLTGLRGTLGTTIVLVTHDADVARSAERVVVVRDGRIVADGTPDAVLDHPVEVPA